MVERPVKTIKNAAVIWPNKTFRAPLIVVLIVILATPLAYGQRRKKPIDLPGWLVLDAEYRVETVYLNPLDLSGNEITETTWTEQRLRLDLGLRLPKIGGVYIQLDMLDGVLFGDNGAFGAALAPNSGLAVASKNPNNGGLELGLRAGADPLLHDSYIPVLREINPIRVRHAWGEVILPVGLIRAGRMPTAEGANIAAHDGGRWNRWGASRYGDTVDRVLFATKIDAIVEVIRHREHAKVDPDPQTGILFAAAFDWKVQDDIFDDNDDQNQLNLLLSWRKRHDVVWGLPLRDFMLQFIMVHNWSKRFDTSLFAFPMKLTGRLGDAYLNAQVSIITGETREIADGLALLSGKVPQVQELLQVGAHVFFEYTLGPVDLALQFDYASGDADPRSTTPATGFNFARDFNVGLLLFEHLMAFQTGRAAAVGLENLKNLDASSFPLTEVATNTRFGNAVAIFPQVTVNALDTDTNKLHVRLGVLAAWTEAGVVDPVATTLAEDGNEISDDAVNFHGGKPGSYYGTEIDLQVEWDFRNFFTWTMEAAVFLPGDAVEDRNGDASTSFLFQNRLVFSF